MRDGVGDDWWGRLGEVGLSARVARRLGRVLGCKGGALSALFPNEAV